MIDKYPLFLLKIKNLLPHFINTNEAINIGIAEM